MSNNVVGSVYEQIIEDVLSTSRVDFEENGVDEVVLDELRRVSGSPSISFDPALDSASPCFHSSFFFVVSVSLSPSLPCLCFDAITYTPRLFFFCFLQN